MRKYALCTMALLVSACAPLRPDEGHALVLRTRQHGDDYLLPVPGPRSIPLLDSEPPDPDKIHVRLSDAEVAELLRRKISARPIREDERRVTVLGNHVVKNEEIYSLEVCRRNFCRRDPSADPGSRVADLHELAPSSQSSQISQIRTALTQVHRDADCAADTPKGGTLVRIPSSPNAVGLTQEPPEPNMTRILGFRYRQTSRCKSARKPT